ncbi:holo-[acyl-carrier-protein] synthase [Ammoniphilus oxalaticus]|uniref:Holo-[acyl-carrier-protein] synthase n=1 Tax=Ammoniphilus oxalaticus TaxID=66863 RepID=A0A419SFQ4_9BACL|nr:holo-ACP synthase [Ammoniphilus oxalaticus]RKD22609.1 holo-[acyl-carrier-protein] synthase [Ammoniphilus oxalaticus]
MIKGIGIDISDKRRIESSVSRLGDQFLTRILTPREIEEMPQGTRRISYVAGRFATKEAFAKATGWGIGERLSWQDMTITSDEWGKPVLLLSEKWLETYDPQHRMRFHISISHEKDYAVAQAIIEEI